MKRALNFINGEFVSPASGEKFFVIDTPATGEPTTEVADSDIMDVVRAIQASNKAVKNWLSTEDSKRGALLEQMASQLETRGEEAARLEAQETGVTVRYASEISVPRAIETLRFFARFTDANDKLIHGAQAYFISNRLPIGVVVAIASYSDPLVRICLAVGSALAAGNCLIVKSSSRTPQTAQLIAEIAAAAQIPNGVFNLLQGRGEEVGRALISHPGLSTIAFTGRTNNAREIQATASEFLKRTQLSLSGSNPVLVFAENDLPKIASKVAQLVFAHQGPVAQRGARIFIQESVYQPFLELLKNETEKLVIGDPLDPKTQIGPLAKPQDHVAFSSAVAQAIKERAKPLCGGAEPPVLGANLARGRFAQPTALYDLTFCSTLQQEEIIGPLATVASFKYQHDAIKHANNSPFGQSAYVFHGNGAKAAKIALKLEAGRIHVGGGPLWNVQAPQAGLKTSGLGREGALESLKFFSRESLVGFDISG